MSPSSSSFTCYFDGKEEYEKESSEGISFFALLQKPWLPCTGNESLLTYLRHCKFPTSYRPLCPQWNALGRPALQTAMTMNLEDVALQEEAISLLAPTKDQTRSLDQFLEFFHNYCSYSVELGILENTNQTPNIFDAKSEYNHNKRTLLASLDSNRSFCQNQVGHDCLGTRLWGPAYSLDSGELWRLLTLYQNSLSSQAEMVNEEPASFEEVRGILAHQNSSPNLSFSSMHLSPNSYQHLRRPAVCTQIDSNILLSDLSDRTSSRFSPFSEQSLGMEVQSEEAATSNVSADVKKAEEEEELEIKVSNGPRSSRTSIYSPDSKRRKEQNRIKSKRHRERMIKQRNLLLDIVAGFKHLYDKPNFQPRTTLGVEIGKVLSESKSNIRSSHREEIISRKQRENGSPRKTKAMQRAEELERFHQVYRITCLLSAEVINPLLAIEILFQSGAEPQENLGQGGEHRLFLEIFISFREQWDILLEAENRLHVSTPRYPSIRRPISEFVTMLGKDLYGSIPV